jgi:hypothetical protein
MNTGAVILTIAAIWIALSAVFISLCIHYAIDEEDLWKD